VKKIYIRRSDILLAHDTILSFVCFVISWFLRFIDKPESISWSLIKIPGIEIAAITFLILRYSQIEKCSWRYATEKDYLKLIQVAVIINFLFFATSFLINRLENIPRSLFIINTAVLSSVLLTSRILYKFIIHIKIGQKDLFSITKIPVLVAGLDDRVELFLRENYKNTLYEIIGVLDNSVSRKGSNIYGIKILGQLEDFDKIYKNIEKNSQLPRRIIVSDKYTTKIRLDSLTKISKKYGIKLAVLPRLTDLDYSIQEPKNLKPIIIEDLLLRDQSLLNAEYTYNFIHNRTILITGAGGTIGHELAKQVASLNPKKLILLESSEYNLYKAYEDLKKNYSTIAVEQLIADIRDPLLCRHIFQKHKPDIVFHAAALKHVPIVESNFDEGIDINVFGTKNIADLCIEHSVRAMVLISTDKAVNPTSMLGATKRVAEIYVKSLESHPKNNKTKFTTVRFGNVLGSSGSVIPLFEKQIQEGGPITITHPEMKRYFMTVREAISLVLQASAYAMQELTKSNLYILDMGEQVYIKDLATNMIKMSGLIPEQDIKITYTGLRPGEKLYEELFNKDEKYIRTSSNRFFYSRARSSLYKTN
jgi:FlaA1/EpsC-like NDP-sugar epimerase